MNPRNRSRAFRLELGRDRVATAAIGLAAGTLLAIAAFRIASDFEHRRAGDELEHALSEHAASFLRELTANAEVVYATRSLYTSSRDVTREEFSRFAQDALSRRSAIRALEWVPRVTAEQRQPHVHRAKQEGFEAYRITERTANDELVSAATRDEYFPVYFLEPALGNEAAMGFDVSSDAVRRRALSRAVATGELALTAPIDLVQCPMSSRGLLALVPVFDEGSDSSRSLAGLVLGVFRFDAIAKEAFAADVEQAAAAIQLELVFETPHGDSEVLYASHDVAIDDETRPTRRRTIEFGGQRWQLIGYAAPGDVRMGATWLPLATGIGIFLLSQILIGCVVVRLDHVRDRAATKQARMLRSVLYSVNDGVLVANNRGRFVLANRAAKSLVVGDVDDVSPASWSETFGIYLPDTKTLYPANELPLARAIRGESSSGTEVFVRNDRAPDGLWLSVNGTPLIDEAGDVRGGVVVFRDISERKEAEDVRQQLANAVDQTADAVMITDRLGMIEYVKPAFEASTGYAREEVLQRNPPAVPQIRNTRARVLRKAVGNDPLRRGTSDPRGQSPQGRDALPHRTDDHPDQGLGGTADPLRLGGSRHDGASQEPGERGRDAPGRPGSREAVSAIGARGSGLRHPRGRALGGRDLRGLLRLHRNARRDDRPGHRRRQRPRRRRSARDGGDTRPAADRRELER